MIVGTATFKIVLSSTMMNSELDRITRAIHRFGSVGPAVSAPQAPAGAVVSDMVRERIAVRLGQAGSVRPERSGTARVEVGGGGPGDRHGIHAELAVVPRADAGRVDPHDHALVEHELDERLDLFAVGAVVALPHVDADLPDGVG